MPHSYDRQGVTRLGAALFFALAGLPLSLSAQGAPPQSIPEVEVATLKAQDLELFTELPGRVSAYNVAQVRPQVGGLLMKRLYEEGAYVKEGQPLYEINDSSYRAAYASAMALLAKAQANLIAQEAAAKRLESLSKIKAASQQDNERAQAQYLVAQAEVASAEAALEMARINLEHTIIRAPLSGRIGASSLTQGALLSSNQPEPLATIQQLDRVYVDIVQSSAQLLRLNNSLAKGDLTRPAQAKVTLTLEDGSIYPHEGVIHFADNKVDPATGTVTLRASFPNPDEMLLPGMFVRAAVSEGVRKKAVLVPQRAVSRDPSGKGLVLLVSPAGKVEPQTFEATRAVLNHWLVESGLAEDVQVIVSGSQKVRPGAEVRVVPSGQRDRG